MTIDTQKLLAAHGSIAPLSPTRLERLKIRALQQLDHGGRGKSMYVGANGVLELVAAARALADAQNALDAQTAEIARLREALETIADYPCHRDHEMASSAMIKIARAALSGESNG